MLITGIRRENQISSFGINDEPDENHETRLISCSSFFDHLLRSLSSIIDNIDPNSFVNLGHYWSHIQIHTGNYYNVLRKRDKVQLQPVKFVSHTTPFRLLSFESEFTINKSLPLNDRSATSMYRWHWCKCVSIKLLVWYFDVITFQIVTSWTKSKTISHQ